MTETAIADHGLIGDLQTSALVTTDGSVDWFCCPRFDSPSVFGALLDDERGGRFRIGPSGTDYTTKQMYFPDTAVLVTRFFTESGMGQVIDFMPPVGTTATDVHRLVRMVQCVRGEMRFEVDVAPRFDYGRVSHRTQVSDHGVVFTANGSTLTLHVVREPGDEHKARVELEDEDLHASLDLVAGEVRGVVLESAADGPPREIRVAEIQGLFDETVRFWRDWLAGSTYTGRWREAVQRSAITLKLMTYAPTGVSWPRRRWPCPSRSVVNATGTTATRGCVMPRSRSTPCSGSGWSRKPRASVPGSATVSGSGCTATAVR